MPYSIQHIADILGIAQTMPAGEVDTLLIDSRKLVTPSGSVFFALEGPRRDGHLFIPELYRNGLRYFVVAEHFDEKPYPKAVFLKVPDTLRALQQIAAHHRAGFHFDVIGITGSNGKTVVKEWLFQLLQPENNIIRSPKSYNSQVGVPLSVWQMTPVHQLAIFEAGISQPGEMEKLETIIKPTIGVLTNIGAMHSEGFESEAQKLEEKLKLFAHTPVVIANGDTVLTHEYRKLVPGTLFSWGRQPHNTLQVLSLDRSAQQSAIRFQYREEQFSVVIPFTDNASVENATTCCAVMLYLKMDKEVIRERMAKLQPVNMRLEFKKGINNCTIINDSYSADINSLSIALDFLALQSGGQKKTVILSDFVESRDDDAVLYTHIAQLLQKYDVERMVGVGPKMQKWLPGIFSNMNYDVAFDLYPTTEAFVSHFVSTGFKDEVILVKGARIFAFEQIVAALQQKAHQTILEIHLDAISHNLKAFQQMLKPATKIMVMVKAFGYGSGGAEVAGILQYHKADYLGVAYADEGVELRKAGIRLPVMVLNSEEIAFDAITDHYLEPDIFSFGLLEAFQKHLQRSGIRQYPVHIEIETGMNRLGFSIQDVPRLAQLLKDNEWIRVQSVFSHLVASEDVAEDAFTWRQYQLLQAATADLQTWLGYDFIKHIANSSGIIRFPQLQMDMVRLGIGLYGIGGSDPGISLQPALTLKSTVAQLKHIQKGETVSYNRRGVAAVDSVIATVRIGYADGYSRRFGNGVGKMLVNGVLAPVIGSVCMDMTMLDVTGVPGVKEGDDVIVFGQQLPIEQLARSIGTIPYEIMTGISQRVKRVYWGE